MPIPLCKPSVNMLDFGMIDDRVVFIGGVGGSGTRAVAEVVKSLGVHIGTKLNGPLDNLDWPGAQCAPLIRDRTTSYEDTFPEIAEAFEKFARKMRAQAPDMSAVQNMWGTKVPGSFFYLRALSAIFENMRYIHVMRHGLDMAFSKNHNQLFNWGGFFDIATKEDVTPRQLLKYWACANTFALQECKTWLPNRHLVVRFEELCADRTGHVQRIADFLGLADTEAATRAIRQKIVPQKSQSRYKHKAQAEMFDEADIATLNHLGFTAHLTDSTTQKVMLD